MTYPPVGDQWPPTGEDPLDALTVRPAAAYEEPGLLKFHLDDVGSTAGRAAGLAGPGLRVGTRDEVLTVADYLSVYVLGSTLHHLDPVAHLPEPRLTRRAPPAQYRHRTRRTGSELSDDVAVIVAERVGGTTAWAEVAIGNQGGEFARPGA